MILRFDVLVVIWSGVESRGSGLHIGCDTILLLDAASRDGNRSFGQSFLFFFAAHDGSNLLAKNLPLTAIQVPGQ
jgi:hypothetical protein